MSIEGLMGTAELLGSAVGQRAFSARLQARPAGIFTDAMVYS
jgi:hypothetical protein